MKYHKKCSFSDQLVAFTQCTCTYGEESVTGHE